MLNIDCHVTVLENGVVKGHDFWIRVHLGWYGERGNQELK
jgi:hypothetical protein